MNLAFMHRRGLGTVEDHAEAARWYRRAADLGNAYGQTSLAEALLQGDGVAKDEPEAARWYRAAVAQREQYAYLPLARLYAEGIGVERDLVEAHALATAAQAALDSSESSEDEAISLQRSLESEMTGEQIDAAKRRAAELF